MNSIEIDVQLTCEECGARLNIDLEPTIHDGTARGTVSPCKCSMPEPADQDDDGEAQVAPRLKRARVALHSAIDRAIDDDRGFGAVMPVGTQPRCACGSAVEVLRRDGKGPKKYVAMCLGGCGAVARMGGA